MIDEKLKLIGKGTFSTVYQKNKNKVLIITSDYAKECMALGWFPKSSLFPKIEQIAPFNTTKKYYIEKYYKKVKSLKKELSKFEYEFYQLLRKISYNYSNSNELVEIFEKLPPKYNKKKQALIEAVRGLSNYGEDVRFELSPRNIAVAHNKLILLDCFFFESQLKKCLKHR